MDEPSQGGVLDSAAAERTQNILLPVAYFVDTQPVVDSGTHLLHQDDGGSAIVSHCSSDSEAEWAAAQRVSPSTQGLEPTVRENGDHKGSSPTRRESAE